MSASCWYTGFFEEKEKLPEGLLEQKGGTHANEEETSMMLYIAPEKVDMRKAVKDFDSRPGRKGLRGRGWLFRSF